MELGTILLFIILSVSINSVAQIVWKKGSARLPKKVTLKSIIKLLFTPKVITGLALYAGSALLWIMVLSNTEVSYAFPFISLGYVMTAVMSYLLLNEKLPKQRVIGIGIIITGVIMVGLSL